MKWRNIMLLSLLCLSCAGLYAQENMKVNSIKQEKDSLKILSEGAVVSPQSGGYAADFKENTLSDPVNEIPDEQKIEIKLRKPFYIYLLIIQILLPDFMEIMRRVDKSFLIFMAVACRKHCLVWEE